MSRLIDRVRIKAGRLVRVWNKRPHPSASAKYVAVWVEDADGCNERCLLFTPYEIARAEDRSSRNLEDLTKKGWFTDLLD